MDEIFRTDDWKHEKHVPVIDIVERTDDKIVFEVTVGKEIPHPNTLEHHIKYIEVFFLPEDSKTPVKVGKVEFSSHGEYDTFTDYKGRFELKTSKKGKLVAFSYCNIHGLWKGEKEI